MYNKLVSTRTVDSGICPVKFSHSHNNRRKGIHYMSKLKILIVDDSQLNREILSCMLEDKYDICEAENGEQAVEILERCHKDFKLVLLDLIMPVMDGYQVLAVMKQSNGWICCRLSVFHQRLPEIASVGFTGWEQVITSRVPLMQ